MTDRAGTPSGHVFDCVVIGGGPAGATAAAERARAGHDVALLDRDGRIKPCGGAIPPRCIGEFDIPDDLLVARATAARVFSPSGKIAEMPIGDGFVGMVDRATYDEWLRAGPRSRRCDASVALPMRTRSGARARRSR